MQYVYTIRMEEWNAGILGVTAETNHFNCKKLLSFNFVQDKLTHHSITPLFHYFNWGEAPKFIIGRFVFFLSFKFWKTLIILSIVLILPSEFIFIKAQIIKAQIVPRH